MGCACINPKSSSSKADKKVKIKNPGIRNSLSKTLKTTADPNKLVIRGEEIVIKSLYKNKKNYLYVISPHNWLNIIDFLVFRDLKESGKINR